MESRPDLNRLLGSEPTLPVAAGRRDGLEFVLVAAALILGLLRFVRLGRWSLWYDEILTWGDAHSSLSGVLNDAGYLLVRWTVELLGGEPTEVHLRLLPALVGYAAVPLTYWAFRPLAGGRRAALCALVVALSAWEIQWSQTARFYTFVQAAGLLGAGIAIRGLLAGRWLVATIGIAVAGSGVMFHLQGAIVAAAIGGAMILAPPVLSSEASAHVRRAGRAAFVLFALPGAAATPLVLGSWEKYAAGKPVDSAVGGVAHFVLSTGSYVTPALAALAVASALLIIVRRDRLGGFALMVVLLGVTSLVVAASQATVSAQYAFAFMPWIALVAAWPIGAEGLAEHRMASVAVALVAALPQLAQTGLYLTVEQGQRPRWRDAVEYVAARREPGDLVVSFPATVTEFYLTGARETAVRTPDSVVHLDQFQPRSYETWVRDGRTLWFVLRTDNLQSLADADRAYLTAFLAMECRMMKRFPVFVEARDLTVEVWRYE